MAHSAFWTGLFDDDSDHDVQEIDEREFLGADPHNKVTESDEDFASPARIEIQELEGSTTEDEFEVERALREEKSTPEADVDFLLQLCRMCHQGLRTDMKVTLIVVTHRPT